MSGHRDDRPRARLATVWLGGCADCHMSFLDLDEWLFDLLERVDVVYSPLMDRKDFPDDVDVVLVEGAVTNDDNLRLAYELRARSATVVAFGDCAVTGNVTALRNLAGPTDDLLRRIYVDRPGAHGDLPRTGGPLPSLLGRAVPLHAVDPVSRIEGHAKITVRLDDSGGVADARFHVTEIRGFEEFCRGRPLAEMPGLTARTCGICPVSHLIPSARAAEAIMSVMVPEAAQRLRRAANLAQIVQSHAASPLGALLGRDRWPAPSGTSGTRSP